MVQPSYAEFGSATETPSNLTVPLEPPRDGAKTATVLTPAELVRLT